MMIGSWTASADWLEARVGRGWHRILFVTAPHGRRVQLVESPRGRNLHVSVDGVVYVPKDANA